MTPFLRLSGIHKRSGPVAALSGVDEAVYPGEVLGLLGGNAAGKSTLMRTVGGVHSPTEDRIELDGKTPNRLTAPQSIAAGIGVVHPELSKFDTLAVAENIFLGLMPSQGGPLRLVDTCATNRDADALLGRLGSTLSGATPLARLALAHLALWPDLRCQAAARARISSTSTWAAGVN
ncbi:MAG: ATP-binding cassette domain-containing protein [Tabrizicola sp.]|nr:ATP-binding cassette domain-containing protein [Tabrizicola sp.]